MTSIWRWLSALLDSHVSNDRPRVTWRPRHAGSRRFHVERLGSARIDTLEKRLLLTGTLGIDKMADVSSAVHDATVNYSYGVTFAGAEGGPTEAHAVLGECLEVVKKGLEAVHGKVVFGALRHRLELC